METQLAKSSNLKDIDLTILKENAKSDLPKYWTREQIHDMMQAVTDPKHRMFLTFLWMTGTRVTEAIGVRKCDLDVQNFIINIRWLKSRKYNTRSIPMHPQLRDMLMLYSGTIKSEEKLFDFSRQRAWQLLQKYFDGHPHQMRHSFAVNWLKCGGEITTLSRVLGHSDIKVTMVYLQIVPLDQGKELIKITF